MRPRCLANCTTFACAARIAAGGSSSNCPRAFRPNMQRSHEREQRGAAARAHLGLDAARTARAHMLDRLRAFAGALWWRTHGCIGRALLWRRRRLVRVDGAPAADAAVVANHLRIVRGAEILNLEALRALLQPRLVLRLGRRRHRRLLLVVATRAQLKLEVGSRLCIRVLVRVALGEPEALLAARKIKRASLKRRRLSAQLPERAVKRGHLEAVHEQGLFALALDVGVLNGLLRI